jgi:hypothetical protein
MNEEEFEKLRRLNPALAALLQFVSASLRNKPYYRAPKDYAAPLSLAQAKHRLAFTESAMSVRGATGLKAVNGMPMPPACKKIQENLGGKRFGPTGPFSKTTQYTIDKIRERRGISLGENPMTRQPKAVWWISKKKMDEINRINNERMRKINEDYRRWLAKMRARAQA